MTQTGLPVWVIFLLRPGFGAFAGMTNMTCFGFGASIFEFLFFLRCCFESRNRAGGDGRRHDLVDLGLEGVSFDNRPVQILPGRLDLHFQQFVLSAVGQGAGAVAMQDRCFEFKFFLANCDFAKLAI